jgi:hypothetical protein
MVRTSSAIFVAALSGALAAPPAFPQGNGFSGDNGFDTQAARLVLDAGTVVRAGDGAAALLYDIDGHIEFESFTGRGRRYGLVLGGRLRRDTGRRAWGGLAGDCPPDTGGCPDVAGPVSGFRAAGLPAGSPETRGTLDTAYLFYDTGWGEVRLGRADGAARLDPAAGPAAFRLTRADGGRVNTGLLSGARTISHISGQDFKLVFRSVALGQESSVGTLRLAASFTPSVRDCGVDACAREYGPAGLVSPVFDDVFELGVHYAIRRGGHEWEASVSAAKGEDATGRPGSGALESLDAGLSWTRGAWSAGVRGLAANNGLGNDRGYTAWAVSAGYETGPWLFTLEHADFSDNAVHVDGNSWQIGGSRLIGQRWIAGAGVQTMTRSGPVAVPGGRGQQDRETLGGFFELGWQF